MENDETTSLLTKKQPSTGYGSVDVQPAQARTVLHCQGICCPAEKKVVDKILLPIHGVETVKVNVVTRTVAVIHDAALVTPGLLYRMLNQANLKARIQKTTAKLDEEDHTMMVAEIPGNKYPEWNVTVGLFLFLVGLISTGESTHCKYEVIFGSHCTLSWFKLSSILAIVLTIFPILRRAWFSLTLCHLDTNCLMSIAVVGACVLYDFVEASTVVILFSLADWLATRATDRAKNTLESIINLRPDVAVLAATGKKVALEDVPVGTELLVKSGDKIPLDGIVVGGESTVNESNLTGESKPVIKREHDSVSAGTINVGTGYLTIRSTTLSEDSAVAKLVRLVEEAAEQRSETEEFVETIAKFYTPIVVISAVLVAVIPFMVEAKNAKEYFHFSLVLLVIACPCALVISTPITYVVGLTEAARDGVLIKGGKHLEALGHVNTVAFDKTGTLTEGKFNIDNYRILGNNITEVEFFSILYTVENVSTHPMAVAICNYAKEKRSKILGEVTQFRTVKGEGVEATLDNNVICIGNMQMIERLHLLSSVSNHYVSLARKWENQGGTVSWVVQNDTIVGVFSARDVLREEAAESIDLMRESNLKSVMLTGDNQGTAETIQREVQLDEFYAKLKPEDKVEKIKQLKFENPLYNNSCLYCFFQKSESTVAMIGDGVNDAPALALADVGIAMGAMGTAVAMETADVSLMDTDLRKIHKTILLGRKCVNKIYQNIIFSIFTKIVILGIAIGGFSKLWLAIITDVGSMLIVTFNSLSILTHRMQEDECDRMDLNNEGIKIAAEQHDTINFENNQYVVFNNETEAAREVVPLKKQSKGACCKSGGCSSSKKRKQPSPPSDVVVEQTMTTAPAKKKKKCCGSGGCSKSKATPPLTVEEETPKPEAIIIIEESEQTTTTTKKKCCGSSGCSKSKATVEEESPPIEKEVIIIPENEPEEQTTTTTTKKKKCCASGGCSKSKATPTSEEEQPIVTEVKPPGPIIEAEEETTTEKKKCCASGGCSKSKATPTSSPAVEAVPPVPIIIEEPETEEQTTTTKKKKCCESGGCTKPKTTSAPPPTVEEEQPITMEAVSPVPIIEAEEQSTTTKKECCTSGGCTKSNTASPPPSTVEEETPPTTTTIAAEPEAEEQSNITTQKKEASPSPPKMLEEIEEPPESKENATGSTSLEESAI